MISTVQIKIPASLLSVAALGVCLGFMLTGPSASFAQSGNVESRTERSYTGDKKVGPEKAAEQFASTFIDLYRIASKVVDAEKGERQDFSLSYFVSIRPNGSTRFTAAPRSGEAGVEWSGKYREALMRLYDAFLPRVEEWSDDMLVQFELRGDTVELKATIVADDTGSLPGSFEQLAFRQQAASAGPIRSQILTAAEVTVHKNKIVVVANLPRAGLQPLLTRNESDR